MLFENLESSIRKNAGEKPSLYMAMCIIRSLFKDVETAAGMELCSVSQGDERLPIEMTFIEGQLLEIYDKNKETFQRGKERLAKKTLLLQEQEAQLKLIGDTSTKLMAAKRQEAELSERLSEAVARKKEVDELERKAEEYRATISALEAIDPGKAEAQIRELASRVKELESERGVLTKQIRDSQQKIAELSQKNQELREAEATLKDNIHTLSEFCAEAETSIKVLNEDIQSHSARKASLMHQHDAAQNEFNTVVRDISEMNSRISSFETSTLNPEKAKLNSARAKQATLEQEAEQIRKQFQLAVSEVGKLNEALPQKRQQLEQKTEELQKKEELITKTNAQIQEIEERLTQKYEELADCQAEFSRLSSSELPSAESLLQNQKVQNRTIISQIDAKAKEIEDLRKTIGIEEEKLNKLNEQWKEKDTAYQTLVAQTRARDESINQLQKHIEELKGKNDEEKALQLKQQLQAEERALQAAEAERVRLQAQLSVALTASEEAKKTLRQLSEDKLKYETDRDALRKKMDELTPYTSKDYVEKSRRLEEQITFLQTSENNLKETMQLMMNVISKDGRHEEWEDRKMTLMTFEDELDHLKKYISKIRVNLSECADSVNEGLTKRRPL